ncbi:flagellin N-terminal helical domain-containing protein [Gluconacetobacter takamatsuzukensis]|uniref:Flagellin n=1 Tax=Gluconacetobacter takamatsuzukensis TaxID=1286190 RepID=A0A7W4KB17_9PROT|nr:flagellin [Gluconacetobacter takamatsuzukensis]
MSLSINTNSAAKIAIETLNATQTQLNTTQNQVSTGLKVSTAADDAAAFGIAQQMQGNVAGQSAVNDGLSFVSQIVSSTTTAANSILSVLNDVQTAVTRLGQNQGSQAAQDQIGTEITAYLAEINTIAQGATFNGINLLASGTTDGLEISSNSLSYLTSLQGAQTTISGFNASSGSGSIAANLTVTDGSGVSATISGASGSVLTDALGLTTGYSAGSTVTSNVFESSGGVIGSAFASMGSTQYAMMIQQVQAAIKAMTVVTSTLGANTNVISTAISYGSTISDNLTNGIGALTDADMSAASARLTSLQTKQQLGIKALSIANAQSQQILSLFQ